MLVDSKYGGAEDLLQVQEYAGKEIHVVRIIRAAVTQLLYVLQRRQRHVADKQKQEAYDPTVYFLMTCCLQPFANGVEVPGLSESMKVL